MNIDDIKKGLECCSNPRLSSCNNCPYNNNGEFSCRDGEMCKDALNLITEQEKEIERLKDENKENCWKCIEAKHVTEEDYAKLQEEFANYQIASDKEMIAQVKQAKIDVLNRLKSLSIYDDNYLDGYVFIDDIDKLLEEYENDA